jgi:hypothetical protein
MATVPNVAARTNRVARKYLAGIIKVRATRKSSTPIALKKPIRHAQGPPRAIAPDNKTQ